jgi:plasmid stabilization system protein ParE
VTRLEVAPQAKTQIETIGAWWRANREAAPELFAHELANALERLTARPRSGVLYTKRRGPTIRRLLLPKTHHHVYFSYDEAADLVEVRAVWHAARGSGPTLG